MARVCCPVVGYYDPAGFPADRLFSNTATISHNVRDLTRPHEVTVKAIRGTEFTDKTVFDIQLRILDVS